MQYFNLLNLLIWEVAQWKSKKVMTRANLKVTLGS